MSRNDYTYQQIEQYLNGELEGEELHTFEAQLRNNQELQEAVENHRLANDLVIENRLQEVSGILQKTHTRAIRKKIWQKAAVGTVAAAGIIAGIWWFSGESNTSSEDHKTISHKAEKTGSPSSSTNKHASSPSSAIKEQDTADNKPDKVRKQKRNQPGKTVSNPNNQSGGEPSLPDTSFNRQQSTDSNQTNKKITETTTDSMNTSAGPLVDTTHSEKHNTTHPDRDTSGKSASEHSALSPCSNVNIKADVSVKETCPDKRKGAIKLENIKGGQPPYNVRLTTGQEDLTQLGSGRYDIYIRDAKNCGDTIRNIKIPSKECFQETSFNPFIGEKWTGPVYDAAGELIIYNQNGEIYFKKDIPANTKPRWSGRSGNGQLKAGYFIYKIKYSDGTVKKGSITIVK